MLLALATLVLLLTLLSTWAASALGTGAAHLEKLAPFECGLEPFGASPKFEILFYLVGLLYLVFDLELVLLFPLAAAAASLTALLSPFAFLAVLLFLAALTLAFLFEWAVGALNVQSAKDHPAPMSNPIAALSSIASMLYGRCQPRCCSPALRIELPPDRRLSARPSRHLCPPHRPPKPSAPIEQQPCPPPPHPSSQALRGRAADLQHDPLRRPIRRASSAPPHRSPHTSPIPDGHPEQLFRPLPSSSRAPRLKGWAPLPAGPALGLRAKHPSPPRRATRACARSSSTT